MFNTIKKLFGVTTPTVTTEKVDEDKAKIAKAVPTTPLTVKPKNSTVVKPKKETLATLEKMTKVQIDDLSKEKFGVEVDRRKTKNDMMAEFLAAQKKAK